MGIAFENTLCTLCLRVWGFHAMLFFNCNILHGALITDLFWVCLVVSQILGEGALVQMFCWYEGEVGELVQPGGM